jgi:transposase-like protein
MSHLLKHKYAQYLARTLISKEDWDVLRQKRDKASMDKKRDIVLAMIDKGVSQRRIADALDTDGAVVQYWIRDKLDYAKQIRRKQKGLARKGLAEFQLWAESKSK